MSNKKSPYKLMIVTNSYTGNFEREFISFCLGLDYNLAFSRPFWDKTIGTGVASYKNYKKLMKKRNNLKMEDDDIFKTICETQKVIKKRNNWDDKKFEEECIKFYKKYKDQNQMTSWRRFYKEFLCKTLQLNDDIKESTFYNICSYEDKNMCDSIYIQLTQRDIPGYFEYYIIKYIFEFFEKDIFNKIKSYIWLCHGWDDNFEKEDIQLKKLLLLDENDNIIKEYKKDDLIELEKKNLIDSFKLQGLSDKAIERNLKVFLKS